MGLRGTEILETKLIITFHVKTLENKDVRYTYTAIRNSEVNKVMDCFKQFISKYEKDKCNYTAFINHLKEQYFVTRAEIVDLQLI